MPEAGKKYGLLVDRILDKGWNYRDWSKEEKSIFQKKKKKKGGCLEGRKKRKWKKAQGKTTSPKSGR